jgi:hypothetical protein
LALKLARNSLGAGANLQGNRPDRDTLLGKDVLAKAVKSGYNRFNMPASLNSTHVSVRKPRKKPRPPQVISPETWKAIEAAVCIGGLGYSECARKFDVSVFAIMQKARRNKWPVPSMIQKRAEALQSERYKKVQEQRYKPYEQQRNSNAQAAEVIAQSWAEKGEQHRALAFNLAHSSLKTAAKTGLPVTDWGEAEKADRMARRSSGLDDAEAHNVSIGMQLINFRLENIQLPKDAFSEFENGSRPQ